MATNAAPLERAAKELSLSVDTLASANEDWLTSAIVLIPVILRPELLKAIGHSTGNTTFYRKLALSVGLKEAKLQVIANHFKNLLDYKEAYRNIDIKHAPISRIQNIHKAAITLAGGKKNLKLEHVKQAVEQAVENNEIHKSKIDYVEDIDRQIGFAMSMDEDALAKNAPTELQAETAKVTRKSTKTEPKKSAKGATSETVSKSEPTKSSKSSSKKLKSDNVEAQDSEAAPSSKDGVSETSTEINSTDEASGNEAPINTIPENSNDDDANKTEQVSPTQDTTTGETEILVNEAQAPAIAEAPTKSQDTTLQANLVKEFLTLSTEDKALIVEIATAFHGDHNLAMLRACSDVQANILLKSIQRIK